MSNQQINVIYDNGGGITLQIIGGESNYQHYWPSAELAAETVYAALMANQSDCADDIQQGWDGNDLDEGIELLRPTDDQERNGGYIVLHNVNYHDVVSIGIDSAWYNASHMSDLLTGRATV